MTILFLSDDYLSIDTCVVHDGIKHYLPKYIKDPQQRFVAVVYGLLVPKRDHALVVGVVETILSNPELDLKDLAATYMKTAMHRYRNSDILVLTHHGYYMIMLDAENDPPRFMVNRGNLPIVRGAGDEYFLTHMHVHRIRLHEATPEQVNAAMAFVNDMSEICGGSFNTSKAADLKEWEGIRL